MDQKRKAISPCESKIKNFKDYKSPGNESFLSCDSIEESFLEEEMISTFLIRVSEKNNEEFKGALDYVQAFAIWEKGLKLPEPWLYGIGLVFSKSKPFLLDFRLNCEIDEEKIIKSFKVEVDGASYKCEYVPNKRPPADIGDIAHVTINKTRWKLTPDQIKLWLSLYGEVVKQPEFEDAPGLKRIKTDNVTCMVKLNKHIPNLLPAYGRRMNVTYSGQPIQCAKCYLFGHVRAKCEAQAKDWLMDYVRQFYEEGRSSLMLGRWFDLFKAATEMN